MKAMSREGHRLFLCTPILNPPQNPVGASLLAKASAHSTSTVPDTPLSRASSLPQVEKCLSVGNVLVLQTLKIARSFPTSRVGCASEIGWIGSGGRCKFSERASRPEQFIRFDA
ncbi:hypothetical protein FGA82_19915 [Pseudomonas fluorescens]|nr:hypothetical protein FGA82_19915 [Pseudomonas fluorescens]